MTTPRKPLLFELLPDLGAVTPFVPLANVPTPVEPCSAIADWLGRRDGVFMKRDDLISPIYGGNKVRRYELVLADAKARGAKRLVTVGGLGSTQAMATTLFGKALGFDVCIVLFEQPVTDFALATVRGFVANGAEIVYGGGYVMTIARTLATYQRGGDDYFIMPGASGPLANIGYVDAMLELAAQVERGEAPRPDVIVVPTGSGGTLAALALGAAHLGWETEIVGVRITTALATNRLTLGAVIRSTDRWLAKRDRRWRPVRDRARWTLYGGALGEGYGFPTPEAREGVEQVKRLTGNVGEVTYSGKALAGLRALVREPRYRDKTFLLWNTLSTKRPIPDASVPLPPTLRWMLDAPPVA